MMKKILDPRVVLMWWVSITLLLLVMRTYVGLGILMLPAFAPWLLARKGKELVGVYFGLYKIILFVGAISLFPSFDLVHSATVTLRYFVMLTATAFILKYLDFGEIGNAVRNLSRSTNRRVQQVLEVVSITISLPFQIAPMVISERSKVLEIMRSRGVDLQEGGRFQQAKKGVLVLFPALFMRLIEQLKYIYLAVLINAYNPFAPRSLYRQLSMNRVDRLVALLIFLLTGVGFVIAFAFKV